MKYLQHCLLLLPVLIVLHACGGNSESFNPNQGGDNQEDEGTSVETITVQPSDISQQIKSFGNVRAEEIIEITPQVSNRVTQIHADLGDTVQQGDLLAKIYDAPYRDQYEQAKSSLEQSRSSYVRDSLQWQRQQELYDRDLISGSQFEETKATFESSKAQLQSSRASLTESRENLNNTEITSPARGVVLTRNIAEGDVASTGEVAYEIANLSGYQVRVYLPLEEWRNVKIGQQVSFRLSNQSEVTNTGHVTQISPRLDPTTGLGEVVISLSKDAQAVYQGALVEATINVETRPNSMVIPRAALIENVQTVIEPESNSIQLNRSYSVFVVQNDSLARENEVELGIEQGERVEILEGIQPGDEIVITGQNNLSDSSKVRTVDPDGLQYEPNEVPIESAGEDLDQDTSSTS